jgi:hypothetical protein
MKRNVSVVCVCLFRCNIVIGFRIIKEMPGLVDSGTPYITIANDQLDVQIVNTFITTLYMYMHSVSDNVHHLHGQTTFHV